MIHIAVLTKEVLEYLSPQKNENFIDCTIGEGGHSKLILEKTGPEGKILGIDADENQIKNCREILENYKERLVLANDSYANLQKIVEKENFEKISGILLDLGWSSNQLKESKRGFSFLKDEPLDMRYSLNQELTAEKIINGYPQKEIEKILQEYGEERYAKKIAENIAKERRAQNIKSALQLVKIIERSAPKNYQYAKIHCATRTFQALRIAVNKELENLEKVLPQAVSVLNGGGRIAVISFHSLEDRIVKNSLKEKENQKILKILTKKPAVGQSAEIKQNPRSRSAKLRAAIKL